VRAGQSDELNAALADKMALEGEKKQLEESLRSVLQINDQLLQKVYEISLGHATVPGAGLHPAFMDAQGGHATARAVFRVLPQES
jgi:hypothetical protein